MVTWIRTLRLALRNIAMHPLRSSLTVLGIFIGVSSVIWLLAIGEGISRVAQEQIINLGARNIMVRTVKPSGDQAGDSGYGLTRADFERIAATVPHLEKALPIRELACEFRNLKRVMEGRLVGTTPDYAELTNLAVDRGRFLTTIDMQEERNYCVLAYEVARSLFPSGDAIGSRIMIEDEFYEVVGVMKPRNSSAGVGGSIAAEDFSADVYIPVTTLWRRIGDMIIVTKPGTFQRDIVEVSQITLQVVDSELVMPTADIVRQTVAMDHTLPDFTVVVPMELLERAQTTRMMFVLFLGMIAAISLVVGGIGIMNIMLATVTERTREIGIRRALGARRRDITRQFLVESVVLSFIGGVLGVVGGFCCGPLIRLARSAAYQWFPRQMDAVPDVIRDMQPSMVWWSIPLALVIAIAVGVLFGVYPARRAAGLDPIEALRHE